MPRHHRHHKTSEENTEHSAHKVQSTLQRRGPKSRESSIQEPENAEEHSYLIKKSDTLGRYLVASRDLPEGAVVINEEAVVVGPAQDSSPVCLGCYSKIADLSTAYRCEKCQWPLCSSKCEGLYRRLGHSQEECEQLRTCAVSSAQLPDNQLYNAITPLRCLLLKVNQPEQWSKLTSMEAHNEVRRKLPSIWEYNQKTVVDRITQDWKITTFSPEDIHTVCGVLEVNAFAVGEDSLSIRGLYPTAFYIAHSCVPNTSHTDDEEFTMKVFTSVQVSKDEMITLSYTNSLQGTKSRREHLKQCKFFDCECKRCKDPTELGTHVSSLRCSECGTGHLVPSEPLSHDSAWRCDNQHCHASLAAVDVDTVVNSIDKEIKSLDHNNVEELEISIRHYSGVLHRNHYLILGLKYTLSQLYGKSAGYLIHQMTEAMLERKKQVCEDILQLFDVLEPGLTRTRGLTMYELHAPIMVLTIQRFEKHKITKGDLCRSLRKVAAYLRDCCKILKFEPEKSQEGSIRKAAQDALVQLKSWEPVVGKML